MQEIVINNCFGGFRMSEEAEKRFKEIAGYAVDFGGKDLERDDPALVQVVKELGNEANTFVSNLEIVEVPDDVNWFIEKDDGLEWVAEEHRTWGGTRPVDFD